MDAATRQQAWSDRKRNAAIAFNDASGDAHKARRILKAKYRAMGLDPMTIILLIQIAIKIWAWAKDNGYLSSIPVESYGIIPAFGEDDMKFAMEPDDDA